MRMEDVLPSRGIENTTPDFPLGKDPLELICAAVNTRKLGFGNQLQRSSTFKRSKFFPPLTHLRVGYLRGLLSQAAALRWNQIVVLGADVLVGIVQTSWAGPRWRAEQTEGKCRVTVSKSKSKHIDFPVGATHFGNVVPLAMTRLR